LVGGDRHGKNPKALEERIGSFLTVWSIVLLRATFVKQDMGRSAGVSPESTRVDNPWSKPICEAHVDNKIVEALNRIAAVQHFC
jgi:hypothetical protein